MHQFPDASHLLGPGLTVLVSTMARAAQESYSVSCAWDQILGLERGRELPGPPRSGDETTATPGQVGKLADLSPDCLWGLTAVPCPITVKGSVHWRLYSLSHSLQIT